MNKLQRSVGILVLIAAGTYAAPAGNNDVQVGLVCCPDARVPNCAPNDYVYVTAEDGCLRAGCRNCDFTGEHCYPCPPGSGWAQDASGCMTCQCKPCAPAPMFTCTPPCTRQLVYDLPGSCPRAVCQ